MQRELPLRPLQDVVRRSGNQRTSGALFWLRSQSLNRRFQGFQTHLQFRVHGFHGIYLICQFFSPYYLLFRADRCATVRCRAS
jgi:hypothetical protein